MKLLTGRLIIISCLFSTCQVPESFANKSSLASKFPEVGVFESEGQIFSRAHAPILTISSRAKKAAQAKAELLAKRQVITQELAKRIQHIELPIKLKNRLPNAILSTGIMQARFSGFTNVSSGLEPKYAWAIVQGEQSGIKFSGIREIITSVIAGKTDSKSNSESTDVLYEVGKEFQNADSNEYWLNSLAPKLKAQITGDALGQVMLNWVSNLESLQNLDLEKLNNRQLKKVLELMPFNGNAIECISRNYEKEGLVNCASQFNKIKPSIKVLSVQQLDDNNASAWNEAKSLNKDGHPLVRILISTQASLPDKDAKPTALFEQAFNSFVVTTGELNVTLDLAFQAVDESICSDTLNLIGAILMCEKCHNLALLFLKQAITMNNQHRYALVNTALCLESLDRRNDALKYARKAAELQNIDAWGKRQIQRLLVGTKGLP